MSANDTIRLLIVNDSRAEVERLISMLNNAGQSVRPQHVESEEALNKLMAEQGWDLMIAQSSATHLPAAGAIRQIKRLSKDIPVILIAEEDDPNASVEGLKLGAADVVRLDQDQHLLLIIEREIKNREHRQRRRQADRKLRDAERRGQQLLESSRDAIAYVQDGMFLYVNRSFAERFGYADKDDMDCMPVIDMVADDDQEKVRQFLKEFSIKGEEAESCQLEIAGITQQEDTVDLLINVAMAIFDEEPCIQFQLPYQGGETLAPPMPSAPAQSTPETPRHRDPATNLPNRYALTEAVENEISRSMDTESSSTLMYLEIDNFLEVIQQQQGFQGAEQMVVKVASYLNEHCDTGDTLFRLRDNAFALLSTNQDADTAVDKAKALCQSLATKVIELEQGSLQCTVSIGVSVVNENTTKPSEALDHAIAAVGIVREESKQKGNGAALFELKLPIDQKSERDIAREIQQAIDNDRFQLMFQPILSLRGSEEEYYEVFLRLLDDNNQLVSAETFMQAAERIGASAKIDRWVMLEAIKTLAEHRSKGSNTRVILNISAPSVRDESLARWLKVAFEAAELPTNAIVFQVDENVAAHNVNETKTLVNQLKELGGLSSISNFGSTLNPFTTLESVDTDFVKVHGSYTQDLQTSSEGPDVLKALIQQLLERQKITIAPYVESAATLSTLWQTGVHYIQGHYLQGPSQSMNYDFNMEG